MGVVPLKDIVDPAFDARYGVPAINIFNDLTMEAVLAAAEEANSPVILQTSVKTVRSIGSRQLFDMWQSLTRGIQVPVTLHLAHPDELSANWVGQEEPMRQLLAAWMIVDPRDVLPVFHRRAGAPYGTLDGCSDLDGINDQHRLE